MSETDFQLLSLYYRVEPWGSELDQLNTGMIAATIANCRQGRRRGDKTSMPTDWMVSERLREKIRLRNQTPDEQIGYFRRLAKLNKAIKITEADSTQNG